MITSAKRGVKSAAYDPLIKTGERWKHAECILNNGVLQQIEKHCFVKVIMKKKSLNISLKSSLKKL